MLRSRGVEEGQMAKLDEGQRKDFIAGYTKLLTAAWSADDFDAFMANLNGNPAGVTAEYGLPMPATGSIEIRTQSDGGESLDQAVELVRLLLRHLSMTLLLTMTIILTRRISRILFFIVLINCSKIKGRQNTAKCMYKTRSITKLKN